jgi:hypothetical protein
VKGFAKVFEGQVIDLTDLEQLIELSQTKVIGYGIVYAKKYMDNKTPLGEVVEYVFKDIAKNGLDVISDKISGHFASFRKLELLFAINRLRGLEIIQKNL